MWFLQLPIQILRSTCTKEVEQRNIGTHGPARAELMLSTQASLISDTRALRARSR